MARVRMEFDLNEDGVAELLSDPAIAEELEYMGEGVARRAEKIAKAEGYDEAEFNVKSFQGHDRQRVHIVPQNHKAFIAEVSKRALTRAKGFSG